MYFFVLLMPNKTQFENLFLSQSFYFFFFKLSKLSLICISRHPSFSLMLVIHPKLFNIMAGPAFPSFSKNRALVETTHLCNMKKRVKILVYVTALTVFANNLICFSRTKIPLKSLLNFNMGTAG